MRHRSAAGGEKRWLAMKRRQRRSGGIARNRLASQHRGEIWHGIWRRRKRNGVNRSNGGSQALIAAALWRNNRRNQWWRWLKSAALKTRKHQRLSAAETQKNGAGLKINHGMIMYVLGETRLKAYVA